MIFRKKHLRLLAPLVLSALALLIYSLRRPAPLEREAPPLEGPVYRVERVVDGDTIVVSGVGRVRYIGVDTPEAGEPFFHEAKKRNAELVEGRDLTLRVCGPSPRDRYGRTLAWVYADGVFVNEELLKDGLASTLIMPPCGVELADELMAAEKQALSRRAGMWAARPAGDERLETIDAEDSASHIGERLRVRGVVAGVGKSKNGRTVFINLGSGTKREFTAVIFKDAMRAFNVQGIDPVRYDGKTIEVTGVVRMYKGRPEIIVKTPSQIRDAGP